MSVLIAFSAFLAAVVICLLQDYSLIWAMCFGIAVFTAWGLWKGRRLRDLLLSAWTPTKKMLPVLVTYALIGCITALWRSSGTIAFCIYYGLQLITPRLFILITFLLTSGISLALGTSFGVVGTAGIILMALGRTGNVDPAVTAGVIIAGAYCGDRCSNASSSAALVAAATGTKVEENVKMMLRTGLLPFVVSLGIYGILSWRNPISAVDESLLAMLQSGFRLQIWTLLPAGLILLLPLCRVPIKLSMAASVLAAFGVTLFVQGGEILPTLRAMVTGYTPADEVLAKVMSGGGIISMLTASVLMLCTAMFAGLLDGLGVLNGVRDLMGKLARHRGRFPATTAAMVLCALVFCNQSTGAVVTPQLVGDAYDGASSGELAQDMENSGIVLAPLIPWNISVSIPLIMLGENAKAIPYAVLLYAIPICYGFTKKYFYPKEKKSK